MHTIETFETGKQKFVCKAEKHIWVPQHSFKHIN